MKRNINVGLISNIDNKEKKKYFSPNKVNVYKTSSLKNFFLSKRLTSSIISIFVLLKVLIKSNNNTIFFASTQYLVYQIVLVKIQLFDDKLFFAIPYYCVVFIYNINNNIIYRSHSHPIFLSPFSFFLVVPVV